MSDFATAMAQFIGKVDGLEAQLLPTATHLAYESIVDGSPITGALGQPEVSGDLKASWREEILSATTARVVTASPYARQNEDGVRSGGKPYVQHSTTGGRNSVRLTRAGWPALVIEAARQLTANGASTAGSTGL